MEAFLLLKPDCLRLGLTREVDRAVAWAGLRAECRHAVELTPGDTRFLWSEYTEDGHVLTRALLDRYLCDGPSEVLRLRGPGAFEAARQIKREIRSRYAMGPFANVVHAAERPGELARQGDHLGGRCAACSAPFPAVPGRNPPRPAGFDFRDTADIPGLVAVVWPRLSDESPPPPYRLDDVAPVAALHLGADRDHTLDSAVTAVWRALSGVDLADAVMLTLWAGRTGDQPIATGSREAVEKSYRVLLDHGVRACGTGPYTLLGC
ncbi:hypothetical protein [Actinoplanes sp. GCM10030250]|uniref:hypothetical protein n=1 Tax=Actinoplanes sp. GCM10030250 TaxID=3273376 RepID=UPI003618409D